MDALSAATRRGLSALGSLAVLAGCTTAPPPAPPKIAVVAPAPITTAPPLTRAPAPVSVDGAAAAELIDAHLEATAFDETGVEIVGRLPGGADAVEASGVSRSCAETKLGRGAAVGDRVSLHVDSPDLVTAVQCGGVRITVSRGGVPRAVATVPFSLSMHLPPGVSGGYGMSRSSKSSEVVLRVPASPTAHSKLVLSGETFTAPAPVGGNAEFVVPIATFVRAALHRQHAIATTGFHPIEYILGFSVGKRTLPAEAGMPDD